MTKYASFKTKDGQAGWGIVAGDELVDLSATAPDLKSAIAAGHLGAAPAAGPRRKLADVILLPVIPNRDIKIFCAGVNYEKHRDETGRSATEHPTIFTRFASSQIGHGTAIVRPTVSTSLDYEGELAVIIGTPGRHIREADALSHVAGYACYNDATLRDWQRHTSQFAPGKNFDGTGAFGPWLVTADETGVLARQRLQTRVNGQVLQEATIDEMIFGIPALIAYCSSFARLEAGDVIVTGTPGGVGFKRTPPVWLKPGDVVEVEIDDVGLLTNTVVDEAA